MDKARLLLKLMKLNKMMDAHEDSLKGDMLQKREKFQQIKRRYEAGYVSDDEYYDALEEWVNAAGRYFN